jgi:hypothetical protein
MAELAPVAKRVYNVSPDPVRLTLADGSTAVYRMGSVEFFGREFRGEGTRLGEAGTAYRLVSGTDPDSLFLGRRAADEDGWTLLGEVVSAERAST